MKNNNRKFALPSLLLCLIFGCTSTPDQNPREWNFHKSEITDNRPPSIEKLNVDVYMDVTGSMEGFSIPGQSNFGNFIDDIESTCL